MNHKEAYILGLMFADGCVCYTTHNRHIINFVNKDRKLVQLVANYLNSNILYNKHKNIFVTSKCSLILFNKMCNYGCVPNKTWAVNTPNIPQKYMWSFMGGFFDGDGSISCNKSINSWKVSIGTASIQFKNWLIKFLNEHHIGFSCEMRQITNGLFYNISMCGLMGRYFLKCSYKHVQKFAMKKKYQRYLKLKQAKLKNPCWMDWEIEILFSHPIKIAISKINNDERNLGWIRTIDSTRHKLKTIYER